MAGLENLFATEPTLPSVQTKKLPDNPQEWGEIITSELLSKYPQATKLAVTVEFKKKDDQSGTAVGAITCKDPQNLKMLLIPVVVRKFELSPLDVWMETPSQAVHCLTNDTFKEVFFVHSSAEGLDAKPLDSAGQYFNDPSLWTTNYPPLQGKYSYASAGYSLLDQISDTFQQEDIDRFRQTLSKEAHVLMKFKKHGHQEIIEKLAKARPSVRNIKSSVYERMSAPGVAHVKKHGPDKYSILAMADQMFDLSASESIDRKSMVDRVSKIVKNSDSVMNEVDESGEKMLVIKPAPTRGVWLYDDITDKPETINTFSECTVKTRTGLQTAGMVFPHVVDFAGKKKSEKIFVSPSHSSIQSSVAGVPLPAGSIRDKIIKPHAARVGQTGFFYLVEDGKAIATVPVTIRAVIEHSHLVAMTLDGVKIKIKRGFSDTGLGIDVASSPTREKPKFLDVQGMLEIRPKEYVIPRSMLWMPMENFEEVSSSPQNWLQKEAATHQDADPLQVRWTGIVYQTKGSDMDRQEWDEREMKVVLASKGASLEKVAQILKQAKSKGKAVVHGLSKLRKKAEIVKEAETTYEQLNVLCKNLKRNLVKEAAEIEDTSTVDSVLSLNFLNPDNIAKFCSYSPMFDKVLDMLAELTLSTRLGLKDIPESATVSAISHLQDVITGLSKMKSGLMKPNSKTASAAQGITPQKESQAEGPDGSQFTMPPDRDSDDHYANGMVDGEMGSHLYMDKARKKGAKALLAYLNGKRTTELNQAQSQMAMRIQPKGAAKDKKK